MMNQDNSLDFINAQYAVFLGFIFNFAFSLSPNGVSFAIPSDRILVIGFLVLYFILDWLTVDARKRLQPMRPLLLAIYAIGILALSVVIVMMNSAGKEKYYLLSGYCLALAAYDIYLFNINGEEAFWTPLAAAIRTIFSIAIIMFVFASGFNPGAAEVLDDTVRWYVVIVVLLKFVRLKTLYKREH